MATHDYVLANAAGAAFRADSNNALAAIVSQNSSATEPTTTYACMPWFDTTNGILKFRNASNTGWVVDDLNSARGSVTMHATTMDIWAEPKIVDGTGSAVTITDIADAPQAGAVRILYPVAGTTITDGSTFDVDGGANYTTAAGDALIFEAVTTSTFKVHIIKSDGTAVVSSSGNGLKNRFINGSTLVDQRNSGGSQTITAGAALAYTVDRWYAYCTGANVTGQRVAGTAPNQTNYRFTGAASVTKIGFAQRIEQANSQDLAGQTATLSVDLANSLLTTVAWTAWYANTADTFGSLASPTRTQIATGTFTVTSTLTRYNTQISIPSGATTGIEIELSVGSQTSGTWTIGRVQLELGSAATEFDVRPVGVELALCQRYYQITAAGWTGQVGAGNGYGAWTSFAVNMRATPTCAFSSSLTAVSFPSTAGSFAVQRVDGFLYEKTANATGGARFADVIRASIEL